MNRRRDLLIVLGAAAVAPGAVLAQTKKALVVIGWLEVGSRESRVQLLAAFKEGLAVLGWKESAQFVIEVRSADARIDRLPSLVKELVGKKPAVIVASGLRAAVEAAKWAPRIPIVLVGSDPVEAGLAASYARPGGMVTGVTDLTITVTEKYLELLLAATPKLRRVGFLGYPNNPNHAIYLESARRSASRHSIEARFADVVKPEEIEPAISRLANEGAQALVILQGALFSIERRRIVKLALAHRWPVIAGQFEWADEGALLSYGASRLANHRRAAWYVDRILKGAKPGDLPIEQPTTFELVINRKTAKAIGLTISQDLLFRADRVIE